METTIYGMIFHNERPISKNIKASSREKLIEKAKMEVRKIRSEINKTILPDPLYLRIWPE